MAACELASSFSANSAVWLTCEAVTNSRLNTDQRWSRWVRLKLLAQMRNIDAQVLPVLFGFRAPNLLVKTIAEHARVPTPGFVEYIWKFALPILLPAFALVPISFFFR